MEELTLKLSQPNFWSKFKLRLSLAINMINLNLGMINIVIDIIIIIIMVQQVGAVLGLTLQLRPSFIFIR